ncbi:hypothetical protein BH10BAC3_BH10BAC3_21620 [soil metagenome]
MFQAAFVLAQCPDRNALWNRLINLKTSKLPPKELLSGLLSTQDSMVNCAYRNDSIYIYLLRKIADIYFEQADYIKAVQYRRKAIEITTANAGKTSVKINSLPGIYYWLAVAYDSLNNFAGKMNALDSSAAIAMRMNYMDRASLTALYTRVEYYFDIGDYHRCIDYAIKCEQLSREYANNEPAVGAGYASSSLGWHVEALLKLKMFPEAENILSNKIDEYKKLHLKNYLGLVYDQLAQVQEQKGNLESALVYFNLSLNYYLEDKDSFNCKQTLKDIGYKIYFKHLNDGNKALAYYNRALKYSNGDKFGKTADYFESLNIYANIGAVYVQKGSYDSAFKYFQLAFDQVKRGSNEKDILHSTPHEMMQFKRNYYLTDLLINKANAFLKQYHKNNQKGSIDNAISIYKVADQLLDKIKIEQTDLESKLFWRSDSRRLYENAIEACFALGNTSDALYFFEKSRAVLLNDQLNEKKFVGEQDIMKQTEIRKKILQLQNEFEKADKSSARFSELQSELFSQKQELDQLQEVIKIKNPLYYQSFLDSTVINEEDIKRKVLNDHVALVEIFTGDSAIYVLLLTAQKSQLQKIDKSIFEGLSSSYINFLSNFDLMNRKFETFTKVSEDLYKLLFSNISLPVGRLIISPDGQYFPFEALVIKTQPLTYLVNDYAVSYTYSARYLLNRFTSTASSDSRNFIGIAPVHYPASMRLGSLPGSDRSVRELQTYFSGADNLTSAAASRNNFLNQYHKYKIIQLYTHSSDSSEHGEPVIYFADSALYLSDLIGDNKPVTRLIVLSACETGKGKVYQGEGVFSFNRGFAALGIPAAITNLWSVDSKSTYSLTELFYKYLTKGLPPDIALQRAKLEYLKTSTKEKSMPCYWAAAVLVGKTDTIELDKSYPWPWIVLIAVIVCVIFVSSQKHISNLIKGPQI